MRQCWLSAGSTSLARWSSAAWTMRGVHCSRARWATSSHRMTVAPRSFASGPNTSCVMHRSNAASLTPSRRITSALVYAGCGRVYSSIIRSRGESGSCRMTLVRTLGGPTSRNGFLRFFLIRVYRLGKTLRDPRERQVRLVKHVKELPAQRTGLRGLERNYRASAEVLRTLPASHCDADHHSWYAQRRARGRTSKRALGQAASRALHHPR